MKTIFFILICCSVSFVFAQAPAFQWARSNGSIYSETARALCVDGSGNVYTAGNFSVTVDFDPSPAVYSLSSNGGLDNFVMKLSQAGVPAPAPVVSPPSVTLCAGLSTSLTATGSGSLAWFSSKTSPVALLNGSVYTTPALTSDTVYFIENKICGFTSSRTSVSVQIIPLPSLTLTATNTLICEGESCKITASGAQTYQWNNTATLSIITLTPSTTSSYIVTGTSVNNCVSSAVITVLVQSCAGLEDRSALRDKALMIYPNPGTGVFRVSTEHDVVLKFTNEIGQLVKTVPVKAGVQSVSLEELSAGIYFVFTADGAFEPQKLVIWARE